jgi:hypothetical protein
MITEILKITVHHREAMWRADVLDVLKDVFVNFTIIFGSPVITFIQGQHRRFHNMGETIQSAMDDIADANFPDSRIMQYGTGQNQVQANQVQDIILEIIKNIQEIQARCAPRNLNIQARSQDLLHNTGLMQTLVTAFESEVTTFEDFKFHILPYLDLVDKIQTMKDRHVHRMCTIGVRLDQHYFDLLPMEIRSELANRFS